LLFFKYTKSVLQQKTNFIKEVYYKLYKLLIIFLKSYKLLAGLILHNKVKVYYRNICIYSKKAKSISRQFKVSRIIIRELSNKKIFFGLHKINW